MFAQRNDESPKLYVLLAAGTKLPLFFTITLVVLFVSIRKSLSSRTIILALLVSIPTWIPWLYKFVPVLPAYALIYACAGAAACKT